MPQENQFNSEKDGNRWLSYFDILGFSKMCEKNSPKEIFDKLAECREKLKKRYKKQWADWSRFEFFHFSDSFIIFTRPFDDPEENTPTFAGIEQVSRLFTQTVFQNEIPVRGAMSFGKFYADRDSGIFFGKALVEACKVSEKCDWGGFVLCSSAAARMGKELASEKGTRCLIEEHGSYANYYKRWNIPVHKNRKCENGVELGTACRFDISLSKVDREKLLRNLEKMRQQAEKPEEKMKHEHTMNFIRSSSPILS